MQLEKLCHLAGVNQNDTRANIIQCRYSECLTLIFQVWVSEALSKNLAGTPPKK